MARVGRKVNLFCVFSSAENRGRVLRRISPLRVHFMTLDGVRVTSGRSGIFQRVFPDGIGESLFANEKALFATRCSLGHFRPAGKRWPDLQPARKRESPWIGKRGDAPQ
jgi:hypothetical protein